VAALFFSLPSSLLPLLFFSFLARARRQHRQRRGWDKIAFSSSLRFLLFFSPFLPLLVFPFSFLPPTCSGEGEVRAREVKVAFFSLLQPPPFFSLCRGERDDIKLVEVGMERSPLFFFVFPFFLFRSREEREASPRPSFFLLMFFLLLSSFSF